MTELFKTKKDQDEAVGHFKSLVEHPGWKLFIQIADENIKTLQDEILENPQNLTEVDLNRQRDKLANTKDMRNTPEKIIKLFTVEEEANDDTEMDPYDTEETLQKRSADVEIDKGLEK